jgi:hypothetical protein
MTIEKIKKIIQENEWVSIATEIRPSTIKDANGNIKPFYCTRSFKYPAEDKFELTFTTYADSNGKVPLANMEIKGHLIFGKEHPISKGAYKLNYIADEEFEVTPLHPGFADALNNNLDVDLEKWKVNIKQSVKGKAFPTFGLAKGQIFEEYDLIYICNNMLFNGNRNIDGRPFDKPENRPTNLQIPLIRR